MQNNPWYREPYVWLVILFPALAVIAGIITAVLALNSDDGLVADDYYTRGLAINRTMERDRVAERYGLQAKIELVQAGNSVRITLSADNNFNYPDRIMISFFHATRKGFDWRFPVARTDNGVYEGKMPVLVPGNWYVQIESDDWRLLQSLTVPL